MKKGNNIRERKDGRFEARYIKSRDEQGRIVYGYCYGQTSWEAEEKRDEQMALLRKARENNLLILGAGSHGLEVMDLAKELRIFDNVRFADDDSTKEGVVGPCKKFATYLATYPLAIVAVGNGTLRRKWMDELTTAGFLVPKLIHPSAIVASSATIGHGTVICARATVSAGAIIGKGCIISSGATIARQTTVPDWTFVDCGEVYQK